MNFNFKSRHFFNLLVILLLTGLPYVLFQGKLYIGGDDSRLLYAYPDLYLKNIAFFSWNNFASIGQNLPWYIMTPFLSLWVVLKFFIHSEVVLSYLAFSSPLILGFVFFQKFLGELIDNKEKYHFQLFVGSLFYILSPILIINQLFIFLSTMWLLGLIPIIFYYFIRYLKYALFKDILICNIWCFALSIALFSIPWIAGLLLPLILALLILVTFLYKGMAKQFLVRFFSFFSIMACFQSFWLIGFVMTYIKIDSSSFAAKVISQGFIDTFTPTVVSTATGNVFYPLLNLFHRQIPFDFGWHLKDTFLTFYDKTFVLGTIYIAIFFMGIWLYRKFSKNNEQKTFLLFLLSLILSLYFFTVNIGPLLQLFLFFGKIPGFTMFRNFYDKFAVGYVFYYAVIIAFSLVFIERKNSFYGKIAATLALFVIVINFLPVGQIVNAPLWETTNVYRNITLPKEYLDFTNKIHSNVSPTNSILSVPFGSSAYTVIKDEKSNNIYAGISPVLLFTGANDIAGHLSFNFTNEADTVDKLIINRDYSALNKILYTYNINYVLFTKNVPLQAKSSYIFFKDTLAAQDEAFLQAVTSEKLFESKNGNYVFYSTKNKNYIFSGKNVTFKRINKTQYVVRINNIKNKEAIAFNDAYHSGWLFFLNKNQGGDFCKIREKSSDGSVTECVDNFKYATGDELSYLFKKPMFNSTHKIHGDFSNEWIIDPEVIKDKYSPEFYTTNPDGSINIEMTFYFLPQSYFYLGLIITGITFIGSIAYYLYEKKNS